MRVKCVLKKARQGTGVQLRLPCRLCVGLYPELELELELAGLGCSDCRIKGENTKDVLKYYIRGYIRGKNKQTNPATRASHGTQTCSSLKHAPCTSLSITGFITE